MVLGSALLNSLFPFLVALLGLSSGALFYAWVWKSCSCLGFFGWCLVLWRGRALSGWLWAAWLRSMARPAFWLMALGHLDVAFTIVAGGLVDMSVVVVVLQLGPVVFIWLAWAGDVGRGNYQRPGVGMIVAALAAAAGAGLAVSSETGSLVWEVSWKSWAGGGVALAGTVVGGCNAFALGLSRGALADGERVYGPAELPVLLSSGIGAVLSTLVVAGLLAVPALGLPGLWAGFGEGGFFLGLWPYALTAFLLVPASGFLWRGANFLTRDLSVNVLGYFLPVFAVCWLWLAGLVWVEAPWLLVLGFVLIMSANLLLVPWGRVLTLSGAGDPAHRSSRQAG